MDFNKVRYDIIGISEGLIMNNEWSELNKAMQTKLKKSDTYQMGLDTRFAKSVNEYRNII